VRIYLIASRNTNSFKNNVKKVQTHRKKNLDEKPSWSIHGNIACREIHSLKNTRMDVHDSWIQQSHIDIHLCYFNKWMIRQGFHITWEGQNDTVIAISTKYSTIKTGESFKLQNKNYSTEIIESSNWNSNVTFQSTSCGEGLHKHYCLVKLPFTASVILWV